MAEATGRMPELAQDASRPLSKALSNTPHARLNAKEAAEWAASLELLEYIADGIAECGSYRPLGKAETVAKLRKFVTMLASAPAIPEAGEKWLPIESAPKDGSVIGTDGYAVGEVFWHDGSECYGHRGEAGWFWECDRGSLLTASNAHVTHYIPWPTPPAAMKGQP